MGKSSKWAASLVAVFAVYLAACGNPQETSEIKAKVDEIQAQQKDILAKLDGLQKGQKTILAKAPAAAAKPSKPKEDPNKIYKIDVADSIARGPHEAPVTIVEFTDYQCTFCSRAQSTIQQILSEYPDTVRVVVKNLPLDFHGQAKPAAIAAMAEFGYRAMETLTPAEARAQSEAMARLRAVAALRRAFR